MRSFVSVLALGAVALAVPSPRTNYVVHEKRAAEPTGWHARRLEADKVLPIRVGLKQRNLHLLDSLLDEVASPESPKYGQHWSPSEVADFFAPSSETIATVKAWMVATGLAPERIRLSPSKGWLEVNATVAEAEELLDTEYHTYEHPSGAEQIGARSYSVPEHIRDHVEIIKPTVHFNHRAADPALRKRKLGEHRLGAPSSITGPKTNGKKPHGLTSDLSDCDKFITPDCLRALYKIAYEPLATNRNSYGIVEFTPQAYLAEDLDLFFKNFSRSQIGQRPTLVSIDGGFVQTDNKTFDFNGESNLDLEFAMALVNPQPVTLLQAGDLPQGASFDNWLDAVDASFCNFEGGDDPSQDGIYPDSLPGGYTGPASCGIIKPPNVVSVSYGQDEWTVTPAYANRQCTEYAKLGMLGTTVLYSSGDDGVAGGGGVCIGPDGTGIVNGTRFAPSFPVTCPYVTAVGATQINPNSTVHDPESACEQVIFSGGGFSDIFPMPAYQAKAVSSYLKKHTPSYTAEQYNNSGSARAIPDLSANGANYVVALEGGFEQVFGTSASSPVVGSIFTLINDARIALGKKPVGFINPAIYSKTFSIAFHDITSGGNQGCGTPGFTAVPGWDPVTGVGTPNFALLLPLFLSLP
ncbi:subtilisin-like protein [Auriscalpium vulgare]|uniref:Subtilisin-like protein n=1 Tax=Auriscalpium vulgare TaxID=40419 RepID=A0ACB8RJB5_9AGAM|nr:subtilisin-like protein [Auriscalpium vulgare]